MFSLIPYKVIKISEELKDINLKQKGNLELDVYTAMISNNKIRFVRKEGISYKIWFNLAEIKGTFCKNKKYIDFSFTVTINPVYIFLLVYFIYDLVVKILYSEPDFTLANIENFVDKTYSWQLISFLLFYFYCLFIVSIQGERSVSNFISSLKSPQKTLPS